MIHQQAYSYPVDLWSTGCVFYSLISGQLQTFELNKEAMNIQLRLQNILQNISSRSNPHLSELGCSFLSSLLQWVRMKSFID